MVHGCLTPFRMIAVKENPTYTLSAKLSAPSSPRSGSFHASQARLYCVKTFLTIGPSNRRIKKVIGERLFSCGSSRRKEGRRKRLDLEAARASPTAGSFEFPAFALHVRFLILPGGVSFEARAIATISTSLFSFLSRKLIAMRFRAVSPKPQCEIMKRQNIRR